MKRILYITGAAHCGSTILDIILGAAPNVCSLGQVADLYQQKDCACGQPLEDCSLWGQVLDASNMPGQKELVQTARLTRKEKGFFPLLFSPARCRQYAAVHDQVFKAAFDATGATTLVDSSKNFARGLALARSSQYPVYLLHLVRDPRGFINSSNKRNIENDQPRAYLRPMGEWVVKNSLGSAILQPVVKERYLRLSYEKLLLYPQQSLARLGRFGGFEIEPIVKRIKAREAFQQQHIFSGNRISTHRSIVFDPQRIRSNHLQSVNNNIFWHTIGWLSRPWGYTRQQSYLSL